MGKVREILDCGAIVKHFHIVWFIFTNIQKFNLIHHYHLSTTPAPILSGEYFNTSAILFNMSALVAVFWLVATLARTKKVTIKKKKNQAKLNALVEDIKLKKSVYIQGSPALCQLFFRNKPHTQIF